MTFIRGDILYISIIKYKGEGGGYKRHNGKMGLFSASSD